MQFRFLWLVCFLFPAMAFANDESNSEWTFSDLDGNSYSLKATGDRKALVLLFATTDCPIANSYWPQLDRLNKEFFENGFEFVVIHEGTNQSSEKLKSHSAEYSVPFAIAMDVDHAIARKVGATKTPEVFVFSKEGSILYQGRIDDRHTSFGKKRNKATREDLRLALQEIDSGGPVQITKTDAVGCSIQLK